MNDSGDNVLLDVRNLKTYFFTEDGVVKAVDGVDFTVKRVTTRALWRYLPGPGGGVRLRQERHLALHYELDQ